MSVFVYVNFIKFAIAGSFITNYKCSWDFLLDTEVQVILYPQQLSKIVIKIPIV